MIRSLTVLYDAECPTCQRLSAWLAAQVQLVPLDFVPAGSLEARRRFPGLDHRRTLEDITVVADDGSVFHRERAMVMCLWATARWRDTAEHAASPWRRPFVRFAARRLERRRLRVKARHLASHGPAGAAAAGATALAVGSGSAGGHPSPGPGGGAPYGEAHAGSPPPDAFFRPGCAC